MHETFSATSQGGRQGTFPPDQDLCSLSCSAITPHISQELLIEFKNLLTAFHAYANADSSHVCSLARRLDGAISAHRLWPFVKDAFDRIQAGEKLSEGNLEKAVRKKIQRELPDREKEFKEKERKVVIQLVQDVHEFGSRCWQFELAFFDLWEKAGLKKELQLEDPHRLLRESAAWIHYPNLYLPSTALREQDKSVLKKAELAQLALQFRAARLARKNRQPKDLVRRLK